MGRANRTGKASSLSMILLFAGCSSTATEPGSGPTPQAPPEPVADQTANAREPGATDATLRRIRDSLPGGWTMTVTAVELRFEREQPAWVLHTNRINAPRSTETDDERTRRIKAHGEQVTPQLTYRVEERWSDARVAAAKATNSRVAEELALVAKTVEHMREVGRKGRVDHAPKTPEDEEKLRVYQAATAKLEATRVELPSCNTETLSLFPGIQRGIEDDMHIVHPEEVSRQAHAILGRLRELCE